MPEYGEVYTLKNDLACYLGLRVESYESVSSTRYPVIEQLGLLVDLSQYGKILILHFKEGKREKRIGIHLGMTGRLSKTPLKGEIKVKITFQNKETLYLYDPRKFGWARILDSQMPELQEDLLDKKYQKSIIPKIQNRKASIFTLLLRQDIARGVGSYLAQESLLKASIHPAATLLTPEQAQALVKALDYTLKKAIRLRGASMRDYFTLNGTKGTMQREFKVYGRAGQTCLRCLTIIEKITISGRGVSFCPKCQF